jgi:glycosyltransferase involved in cell wall biosynthesis
MSSGLVVVGTAVGGAAEILVEEENSLLFPPGDPNILAIQINELIESPELRNRLAQNGFRQATEKFDIKQMIEGIESYLLSLAV